MSAAVGGEGIWQIPVGILRLEVGGGAGYGNGTGLQKFGYGERWEGEWDMAMALD